MFFWTETPELDVATGLSVYAGRNVSEIKRTGEEVKCFIDKWLMTQQTTFEAGRDLPQSEEKSIHIGTIGTKYFDPWYISIQRKTATGTELAAVQFFARSNRPGWRFVNALINALFKKNTNIIPDEYYVCLKYKENGNAQEYYLEIRDAQRKEKEKNPQDDTLPEGKIVRKKLEFGKMLYQQNCGCSNWVSVDL